MARKKIGDILIEKGLITTTQLKSALNEQGDSNKKVGEILVDQGVIDESQLLEAIAERLKIPSISVESLVVDPMVVSLVPVEVARRYTLLPIFKIMNNLTVAMADPLNIIAIEELKYLTKLDIKRVVSSAKEIRAAIDQYYSVADSLNDVIGNYSDSILSEITPDSADGISVTETDAPVVKLVNLIIDQAVKDKASDIHIEPDEHQLRIRYRVNGIMKEEASPPKNLQSEIVSRIKVASNMDVSEKRLPQDGRLVMNIEGSEIDLRISTLPTIHGEKVVIRILDKRILDIGINNLGFEENQLTSVNELINKKEGMILITGPTSSGKTTTLYSLLQAVNSIEKNIITIEDPVEYSIPLINQVQTNDKAGLTFARTLRAILRQNPDIIMLGEIRDTETAMMAVRSALTGHLVLSTLHTNDAPSAITRLVDMGIEKYLVASSLKGVIAQRLMRTNCPGCKSEYQPIETEIKMAGLDDETNIKYFKGSGCNKCRMTGFSGQIGIYELISIDDAIAEMVINNAGDIQIRNYALTQGYKPLYNSGIEKIKAGIVSLEEFLRVITISEHAEDIELPSRDIINA